MCCAEVQTIVMSHKLNVGRGIGTIQTSEGRIADFALLQYPCIHNPNNGRAQIDVGLTPADMTGGTKPMTAGMVLACNDLDVALEHVPTQFSRTINR